MRATLLPRTLDTAVLQGELRTVAHDFRVYEIENFTITGEGEHLLLRIEKTGKNTAYVAKELARWAGIQEQAVGYAGLKDRHAVTEQYFSLHLPKRNAPGLETLSMAGVRLIDSAWHAKKIARGALIANKFVICIRNVHGDPAAIEQQLEKIHAHGVPNYFGAQRFGRDDNLAQARQMFENAKTMRKMRRDLKSILLSAARSHIFNEIVAERVRQKTWNRLLDGDVPMLDGTHSIFGPVQVTSELQERMQRLDIHPTAALWGRGELRTADDALALEHAITQQEDLEIFRHGLEQAGLKQERRSTRLRVQAMQWQWLDAATLQLEFQLGPGSYATTVLDELGDIRDLSLNASLPSMRA